MQMPFDESEGFLAVGGNPLHDDDPWRIFCYGVLFRDLA